MGVGHNPVWLVSLQREGRTQTHSEDSCLQAKERPQKNPSLKTLWSQSSSLQNWGTFYCLSHAACGTRYSSLSKRIHRSVSLAQTPRSTPTAEAEHARSESSIGLTEASPGTVGGRWWPREAEAPGRCDHRNTAWIQLRRPSVCWGRRCADAPGHPLVLPPEHQWHSIIKVKPAGVPTAQEAATLTEALAVFTAPWEEGLSSLQLGNDHDVCTNCGICWTPALLLKV